MEEKIKNFSREIFKFFGVVSGIIVILAMYPESQKTLTSSNCFVINNEESASQPLTECDENTTILVEFKCDGKDFPNLLSTFLSTNKKFSFKAIETIGSENPEEAQGFVATFSNE